MIESESEFNRILTQWRHRFRPITCFNEDIEKQNEPFKIYELATSRLVLKGLIRSNQIDVTSLSPGHFYLQVGRSRIKFTKQK